MIKVAVLLAAAAVAAADTGERTFQGNWKATNRAIEGQMTCIIKPVSNDKWEGRFFGKWQGAAFDYKMDLQGPLEDLRGTALVDGTPYRCRGRIDSKGFRANFSSDRYRGSFDLRAVRPPIASAGQ